LIIYGLSASGQEEGLAGKVFQQSYKDDIKGFYLAKSSGDLMVYGTDWLEYYDSSGRLLWKKSDFKYVCGGGVSRDGNSVLFQTSSTPKTQQTLLDLTVHLVDRAGKDVINQANPYRYFTSTLSPKGSYIVFGDPEAKKIYVLDRSLNPLWERETWLWYIGFDADEQFVFDSTLGLVLNNQGRRVWELPSGTRPLSISRNADVLVSQRFLTAKNRNQIFLTGRNPAQQAIVEGYYATVSFDGSLAAYQGMDRKIQVYRTQELFDKINAQKSASPLWTGDLYQVSLLQFSMDNSKLVIVGETSQKNVRVNEIDLGKGKNIWMKEWINSPPSYLVVSEDARYLAAQKSSQFEYFRLR